MLPHQRLKNVVLPWLALSSLGATLTAWAADQPPPQIPTCDKRIGTLAVTEPENKWWLAYNLESPEALIKVFVSQSKCFTLLDRGKGLAAAQQERALAGSGEMRGGSNVGKGQMKAAGYVLVPDGVTKLVNEVKGMTLNAKADNATQSVTMAKPGKMYEAANIKSKKVRDLDPGMTLYPSGEKDGLWWKVSDELGNEGWVPSTLFQLAK